MRQITFQKVLQTTTVPQAAIGELCVTPDGREWVYVKANEALSKSHALTRVADSDQDTVSSSTDENSEITKITQASAGWTVGQFEDAYGLVDDGTNEGQGFKVKTNSADTLFLYRDYRLTSAMDVADSDIVLVRPYLAEKVAVTTLNQVPLGIAQVAFAANDYGFVLRRGPGFVTAGAALVANEQCTPGDDTEGEVIGVGSGETFDDASTFGRTLVPNTTADKDALIDTLLY